MEKLELYRSCIKNILLDHSQYKPAHGEIEVQPIFDRDRDKLCRCVAVEIIIVRQRVKVWGAG